MAKAKTETEAEVAVAETAVATATENPVAEAFDGAAASLPAVQQQGGTAVTVFEGYEEDAGAGMENISRDEYKLPFLRILQALSPQCQEGSGVDDVARPGKIFNTGTGAIYEKDGFEFIPVDRLHNFPEFIPRENNGGGFVGIHAEDDPEVLAMIADQGKFKKLITKEGNEIAETYYLFVVALPSDEAPYRAAIAFSSSMIKKYQEFIGRAMGISYPMEKNGKVIQIKPPLFAHKWRISTVLEKGKKGTFYNWKLEFANKDEHGRPMPKPSLIPATDALYLDAKEFYTQLKEGKAKIDYGASRGDDDGDNVQPPQQNVNTTADDEIPFA